MPSFLEDVLDTTAKRLQCIFIIVNILPLCYHEAMPVLVKNKKAHLKYEVMETLEAGIVLSGLEVRSLRQKQGSLDGSFVTVRGGEVFLLNTYIPPYQPANTPDDYDPYRPRKLLLTGAEIATLSGKEGERSLTVIPLSLYTKGRYLKVEVAVVRGKKKYDKREDIKKRDTDRDLKREFKRGLR